MKAELRFASTMNGVLCVVILGRVWMLVWCVDSWDTLLKVSNNMHFLKCIFHYSIYQQMQWPSSVSTLVLALAQSTWMMLAAGVVKVDSLPAHIVLTYGVPIGM